MSFLACGGITSAESGSCGGVKRRTSDLYSPISAADAMRTYPSAQSSNTDRTGECAARGMVVVAADGDWASLPQLEPQKEMYTSLLVIGQCAGGFGSVHLARHTVTGSLLAARRVCLERCDLDLGELRHEAVMAATLRHHNLLPTITTFVAGAELWTVVPLAGFGSCRDLLAAGFPQGLPEPALPLILHPVLTALSYLHSRSLIHRAVRASHILVASSGHVTLSGLRHTISSGTSKSRDGRMYDFPRHYEKSLLWAAPELLNQDLQGYTNVSDIYSVGIMTCELINGVVPFSDLPAPHMLLQKMCGNSPGLYDADTIDTLMSELSLVDRGNSFFEEEPFISYRSRKLSPVLHEFVHQCLTVDQEHRPSAAVLLQHAALSNLRSDENRGLRLVELLKPVEPLTTLDISELQMKPSEDVLINELVNEMDCVGLDERHWSFD